MVSGPLIVTETHTAGISLYTLKITPVFVQGMRFMELVTSLHSATVIATRCLTRQNIKLCMPDNRAESVGSVELHSNKRFRHIMIDMIRQ